MSGSAGGQRPSGAPGSLIGTTVRAAARASARVRGVDVDHDRPGGDHDRAARLRDAAPARRGPGGPLAGRAAARQEAVVGGGHDPQRRHAGALAAFDAVAVLHAVAAAGVMGGFGDRQAVEGAAEPVDREGADDQALEDVVRDRLVLERVAAGARAASAHETGRAEGGEAHARSGSLGAELPRASRGSGW